MRDFSQMSLRELAGQLVFFGFDGYEMNGHARRVIRESHIGNVILFTRNFKDVRQFFALVKELQAEAMASNGVPLFVAADQEGGSVTRMVRDVTWFPGPMALRAAGGAALAGEAGDRLGWEMARMGLNFNLAPLVDLADNPDSAHIGSRSFGADAMENAPYAAAFLQGVQKHVLATAKHFPSIGGSAVDLHQKLGRNTRPLAALEACEFAPAREAVRAGVAAVMTSHEVYPAVEDCPGTLSQKLVNGMLRERFGFDGLIISDCMEMKALAGRIPTPQGCVEAVRAGVDLLLVCHTEETQHAAVNALTEAVESGYLPLSRLREAAGRVERAKRTLPQPPANCPNPVSDARFIENAAFADSVCERALTVQGDAELFTCGQEERFLLLAPPPAAMTVAEEGDGAYALTEAAGRLFPNADCVCYPMPLTEEARGIALEKLRAGGYTKVLVATCNAHMDAGQPALLRAALASGMPVGAIALRSPYDARWFEGTKARLFAYEYTPPMVRALLRALQGALPCGGSLPVRIPKDKGGAFESDAFK